MNVKQRISAAIRHALDQRGIELTWSDTDKAAELVMMELEDELEESWMYRDLNK